MGLEEREVVVVGDLSLGVGIILTKIHSSKILGV